ncbi:MAG TPA: hypothetical protein VG675_02385 [Bryobacteraceae bacterium]|nr:hypothetical protein [Bryobacteraceae bacterium]
MKHRRVSISPFTVWMLLSCLAAAPGVGNAQFGNRTPVPVGEKIADGQAYVTLVHLQHQPDVSANGRILIAFEENGMAGIPIYESKDSGASWQLVTHATGTVPGANGPCNLHWQPNLTETPRALGSLAAGTILLSASTVCNSAQGRMSGMHLQLYTSTDIGRTWQYRGTVAEGTTALPVWEPNLQILNDGKLVTFYSSETHKSDGYNQILCHKVSSDEGKTWGPEVYDVASPGGVERPGMAVVDRLPDGRYVMSYEDVDGPVQDQVYIKFSRDGLNWGNPADHGTPIQTEGGEYPINCPVINWFPTGGRDGVLIVSARSARGGGDPSGRSLFWNTNNGVGPWWEAAAPVQKLMNTRSGWTQELMWKPDGTFLHITSSASLDAINDPRKNQILFASKKIDFNRYEAEDAERRGSALLRDASRSNGAKVRLGAKDVGRLTFHIHVAKAGTYRIAVRYEDIGFSAVPRLIANGAALQGQSIEVPRDPATAGRRNRDLGTRGRGNQSDFAGVSDLKSGNNTIEIAGGPYAVDVDYLEITTPGR